MPILDQYSAALEVQTAMIGALNADLVFPTRVTGVFDGSPDGQAYPYVTVGGIVELPYYPAFQNVGKEVDITWDIWSTDGGKEEMLGLVREMNRVFGAGNDYDVARSALPMTHYSVDTLECDLMTTQEEQPSGTFVLYHGIVQYRVQCRALEVM